MNFADSRRRSVAGRRASPDGGPAVRALCAVLALLLAVPALAGPPFLTDDPVPIPYRHKEFYVFSTLDKTADGKTIQGPAIEFNYGFAPDFMVHMVIPYTMFYPDAGETGRGLGDIELGVKYRFLRESATTPQVGVFPFVELPTGSAARGTGNGRVWYRIPVWAQKSWGAWTTDFGGGYVVDSAPGTRDYWFGGWLLQRVISNSLTLGGEVFAQQASTVPGAGSTFLTFGGYYGMHFCGCQLLFDGGRTIAGETHTVAYLGLYWTWGPA